MGKYIMALDAGTTSNRCILFNEKETKEHIVRIEIPKEERENCFTILGFGYVI